MNIPIDDRTQYVVSSTGREHSPDIVVAKSALWCVFSRFGSLYLKEYNGRVFKRIRSKNKNFYLSPALDSQANLNPDRFWLWEVTGEGSINLIEIEPFSDKDPIVHREINIENENILNIRAEVHPGEYTRVFMLTDTPRKLHLKIYANVLNAVSTYEQVFPWNTSRLDSFSTGNSLAYIEVSSPPNVYEQGFAQPSPYIDSVFQVVPYAEVTVKWNTVDDTDQYQLQRSTSPTFTTGVETVYEGVGIEYTDLTPSYSTFYYRVRSRLLGADVDSDWSNIEGVTLHSSSDFPNDRRPVIYVDLQNGSDANLGDILHPVRTLFRAYEITFPGSIIILQNGGTSTSVSYGNLTIDKNLTIRGAYGSEAYVGTLTVTSGNVLFENLIFNNTETGIAIDHSGIGSVAVKDCTFNEVDYGIQITNSNYVSVHRNTFTGHKVGIKVEGGTEVNISSNVFDSGFRSIDIESVERLDLWRNTIYGAGNISLGISPDENLRIVYVTLSSFNISTKRIQLPGFASESSSTPGNYDVVVNTVNGPAFDYGTDYTVTGSGSIVSWDGLSIENTLQVGDILRVMYSEGTDPGGGDAIRLFNIGDDRSRVDSNSITGVGSDILFGVFFNTPIRIRHNNFFGVTGSQPYSSIVAPTEPATYPGTNFSDDPLYVDPGNLTDPDFRLQSTSPNIDSGDYIRWGQILEEMGIEKINGSYTGISPILRHNVAAFNRDIDRDGAHRLYGDATGDVGAYEYLRGTFTGDDYYVDERGYDLVNTGTESSPLATLDRGAVLAGTGGAVIVHSNKVIPYSSEGYNYGRYRSKNIRFSSTGSAFTVGSGRTRDMAYVYPSFPTYATGEVYVSNDGNDSNPGTHDQPFRTINRALQESQNYVIVKPGIYNSFESVAGKHLIGVSQTDSVLLYGKNYNTLKSGYWSQDTVLPGSASFSSGDVLTLTPEVCLLSDFSMESKIDFKATANINTDEFIIRLVNDPDSEAKLDVLTTTKKFIEVKKSGTTNPRIYLRYGNGTNSYSSSYSFTDTGEDVKIRIILDVFSGIKFRVKGIKKLDDNPENGSANIENVDISKDININKTFEDTEDWWESAEGWRVAFYSSGGGTTEIKNMKITASDITDVEAYSYSKIKRKVFAILGA